MNKIYKVVWNRAKHCYTVASELAKGVTKGATTGRTIRAAAAALAVAALFTAMPFGTSYAALGTATAGDTGALPANTQVITGTAEDASNIATKSGAVGSLTAGENGSINITAADGTTSLGTVTVDNVANATKATQDANGNNIADTYATKTENEAKADATKAVGSLTAGENGSINITAADGTTSLGTVTVDNVANATKATQDANGNNIADTYATKTENEAKADATKAVGSLTAGENGSINITAADGTTSLGTVTVDNVANATKATQDANGNNIAETYATKTALTTEQTEREAADTAINNKIGTIAADGNYIKATDTISDNLKALDTQAKTNAENITTNANAIAQEKTDREAADTTLQTNIDKEVTARKAADAGNVKIADDGTLSKVGTNGETTSGVSDIKVTGKVTSEGLDAGNGDVTTKGNVSGKDVTATDSATVGTTESGVTAKNDGTLTATGKITGNGVDAGAGGVTTTGDVSGANVTATNSVTAGTGDNQVKLDGTNGAITGKDVTATGTVQGKDVKATESISAGTTITAGAEGDNQVKLDGATGAITGKTVKTTGDITSDTTVQGKDLKATEGISAANDAFKVDGTDGSVTTTGNINGKDITATGALKGDSLEVTNNATVGKDLGVGGNATVTGTFSSNNGRVSTDANSNIHVKDTAGTDTVTVTAESGTINANTFQSGAASISNGQITGTNVTATGNLSGHDVVASGNISGHDITASGNLSGQQISGTSINVTGTVSAAGGRFKVDDQGNVDSTGIVKGTTVTDGVAEMNNGNLSKVNTISATGNITTTNGTISGSELKGGSLTVDNNASVGGNLTVTGGLSAGNGNFSVDATTGKVTAQNGIDAGASEIKTTGNVSAGSVETGTLHATGDATFDKNVTVTGTLKTGEFNADKIQSGDVATNNYTTIENGSVTSKKNVQTGTTTQYSQSVFDENGSTIQVRDDQGQAVDSAAQSKVTAHEVSQYIGNNSADNAAQATKSATRSMTRDEEDHTYTITDNVKDTTANKDNTSTMNESQSQTVITEGTGDAAKTSTFQQRVDKILSELKANDEKYNVRTQLAGQNAQGQEEYSTTEEIKNGNNSTTVKQTDKDITNTAKQGTITNDAQALTNTADQDITNTSTNGNISNTAENGTISNKAKTITNESTEDTTNKVGGNLTTTVSKNQTTTVTGDSSLTADNINNTAQNKITNKAIDIANEVTSSITDTVKNAAGTNTTTKVATSTKETFQDAEGGTNGFGATYERGLTQSQEQLLKNDYSNTEDKTAEGTHVYLKNDKNVAQEQKTASQLNSDVTDGNSTATKTHNATTIANKVQGYQTSEVTQTEGQVETKITGETNQSTLTQKANQMTSKVGAKDGSNGTEIDQTPTDLSLKAESGTLSTKAKTISNESTGDTTNKVGGNLTNEITGTSTTTVTGKTTENYKGGLETNVTGDESHSVTGKQANKIDGDQENTIGGNQTTTVTGDSSLTAKNINNTATEKISNSAADIENKATNSIKDSVGANVSRDMTTSKITEKVQNADGSKVNSESRTASKYLNKVTDGTKASSISQKAGEIGFDLKDGDNYQKQTNTIDGGTVFENSNNAAAVEKNGKTGEALNTTIKGNTVKTGEATMDFAEVLKDLGVRGDAVVDGNTILGKEGAGTTLTVNSTSTFKENATFEKDVKVEGNTETKTLHVTGESNLDGDVNMGGNASVAKDLSVGGSVTATSYKVGDKTYISEAGLNANNQKITNVAPGEISATSTDAINGSQLHETNMRVDSIDRKVEKLDNRVDKVGANAAAMANLHPLEFDPDSKWNIAAAVGNYRSETATAVGAFYRPNEDVQLNISTSFGNGENMVGGGVSLRLGHGGNKAKAKATNDAVARMSAENQELRAKVDNLTARMDALLSVINPAMSQEFPDVPQNHWAYEAVSKLAGNGIVEGYEDGKFHGEETMTRYQMAEIIYNALAKGAKAEQKLVEEFKPELQAMAAQKQAGNQK